MKVSSKYKRFKRINFTGNTLTSLDVRSLIIRNLQRCNHYPNTDNLKRLEKEAQIKEIDMPKTDRILSVSDRALYQHSQIPISVFQVNDTKTKMYNHDNYAILAGKTYLIIEMIPHLVFYSYATKYHNLASMFVPGYQCSNVYINVEKSASMNKDIQ
jgi:hypothetical protein